ncbi:MAG: PKD domain-containing protein, partial [Pedobacter agri]
NLAVFATSAPPVNDEWVKAINLPNTSGFCSEDAAYNNIEATPSSEARSMNWPATGNDVWFKFTATKYAVNITVSGQINAASMNTLNGPLVALYTINELNQSTLETPGTVATSSNVSSLYVGTLKLNQVYYVRVSAQNGNMGSFKLCLDNYTAPIQPGQDCGTFSLLCSKETFTQLSVNGAGANNTESAGTCLGQESNSAWYMFKASKGGDFTFLITPTVTSNDIDWIFYDLGVDGDCSKVNASNAIRCASGSGTNCSPSYYKTGLSMTETDLSESAGCVSGQNGLVKYVDLIEGHTYALLVDNFSPGNNGFTVEFGGTADFAGPAAHIDVEKLMPCTDNQAYIFRANASNYSTLTWSFGDGASMQSATGAGPFTITYGTPGQKTVILDAKGSNGCSVITTETIIVAKTPDKPSISASDLTLCEKETLRLSTPVVELATYHWSGPNGFSSVEQNPEILITGPENAGRYELYVQVGDCISEVNSVEVLSVDLLPKANFSVTVNKRCEPGQSYTLSNLSTGYARLRWDLGSEIKSDVNLLNDGKEISFLSTGKKIITLTVESTNGCTSIISKEIVVEQRPEKPEITSNQSAFCLNDTIILSVPNLDGIVYSWTGPNNFIASSSSISIPVNDFNVAGLYEVTLTSGSCISIPASITIPAIARIPIASFSTDPGFNVKFAVPAEITFKNSSSYSDYYLWDFGDGFHSTGENPNHIYQTEGIFKITLTAYSNNGCFNSVTQGDLIIKGSASVFVPNAFSPNGDGINDELNVGITNLKKYQVQIYNRMGSQVFSADSIFDNWKGDYKGNQLPVGVYYYLINGINLNGIAVRFSGSVTLIR